MSDSAHAQEGKRLRSDPNFTSRCSRPWLVSFSVLSVMADPGTYANHLGSRCRVASWTMHRNRSDGGRKSSEQDRKRKRHRNREKGHWAREEKKWKVKIRIKKKKNRSIVVESRMPTCQCVCSQGDDHPSDHRARIQLGILKKGAAGVPAMTMPATTRSEALAWKSIGAAACTRLSGSSTFSRAGFASAVLQPQFWHRGGAIVDEQHGRCAPPGLTPF